MRRLALLLSLVLVVPLLALAQEASVPEIAYDSAPNLLKLPPDLYLGEAAGVAVNSKAISSYSPAAAIPACSNLTPAANSCARSARTCTASPLPT